MLFYTTIMYFHTDGKSFTCILQVTFCLSLFLLNMSHQYLWNLMRCIRLAWSWFFCSKYLAWNVIYLYLLFLSYFTQSTDETLLNMYFFFFNLWMYLKDVAEVACTWSTPLNWEWSYNWIFYPFSTRRLKGPYWVVCGAWL